MWGTLRIILLVVNAGYFALWGYIVISQHPDPSAKWWQYLIAYGLGVCLAFNLAYLWLDKDRSWPAFRSSNWRIFRLIGLWFDAKESELRQRARQDK